MSAELAIHNGDPRAIAKTFIESGMFPDTKTEAQAVVKILAGQEYGLGPFAAMRGIHIIQGQAVPGAHVLAGRVKSSGRYTFKRATKSDDLQKCSLEFFERTPDGWDSLGIETFTMEDAKRAGLLGKTNWQKYPRNMLFARALANGVRFHSPDITGGPVLVAEELDEEYTPPGAVAQPVEVVNQADRWRPSEPQIVELRELYGQSGWSGDEEHARLRMTLLSVGASNQGDLAPLLAALTEDQFAKLREALLTAGLAEAFDATEEKP